MKKQVWMVPVLLFLVGIAAVLVAQQSQIGGLIQGAGDLPLVAIPNLRGSGESQALMETFNARLQGVMTSSATTYKMVPQSFLPSFGPQTPQEFKAPVGGRSAGPWLTDYANPPVGAKYLAFGYTAVQNGRLVLFGWFYDVTQPTTQQAQIIGKLYFGDVSADGAKSVADQFSADILNFLGVKSLAGTKIWYIQRTGRTKEVWSVDWDGNNPSQFTRYGSLCTTPTVSQNNDMVAFTDLSSRGPMIRIHSIASQRRLPFVNPDATTNSSPEFSPDGKKLYFSSTLAGGYANIYVSNVDGSGATRLTSARAVETEPKVNPKNGSQMVFVSGRSGNPQIWMMNTEGTDLQMLTPGDGEAVNPSWSPDGTKLAFSWTRGFSPGTYNVFVMDVATRNVTQLTRGAGRNENPTWAPDGVHLAFASTRSGGSQVFTMRADGQDVVQVTKSGWNEKPVWSKK